MKTNKQYRLSDNIYVLDVNKYKKNRMDNEHRKYMNSRLVTTEEYKKSYDKNKKFCKRWHKRKPFSKAFTPGYTGMQRIFLSGEIWETIMVEQQYEPEFKGKLYRSIW